MQIQSLAIFVAIAGFVAAAPTPEDTQPAAPSYADFPEGILPLDFSTAFETGDVGTGDVETRDSNLQRRACPGGNFPNCIQIQGQICIFGCGFRNNFSCLTRCPAKTHVSCVQMC